MEPYALCLPWGEGIRAIVPTAFRCLFSQMPGRSLPGAILSRESTTVRPRRPWHEPSCCLPPCSGRNNLRCVPEIRNTGKCWAGKTGIPCGLLPTRFLLLLPVPLPPRCSRNSLRIRRAGRACLWPVPFPCGRPTVPVVRSG